MSKLTAAFGSPQRKRQYVRTLFATIADRYDLITVLLSFGRDRAWKARLILEARLQPGERVFDLACGTGDLTFAAARAGARVSALDITPRMLELAAVRAREEAAGAPSPGFVLGDMGALPFRSGSADVVTTGYGLRNVPDLAQAIAEIQRVLAPGGRFLSLDFNRPQSRWIRALYFGYLTVVGSALGWILHRDPDTYRYIPESLRRYRGAQGIGRLLQEHGFADVRLVPLLAGFMILHVAVKSPANPADTGNG